jgi:hypothetical protein
MGTVKTDIGNNTQGIQLLREVLRAFEETTARPATIIATELRLPQGVADAEVQLDEGRRLIVEVKHTLKPTTLGHALAQLQRFGRPGLLVTRYVTPPMAERLKQLDVPFLDAAGNAYVRTPKMLIYVTGRKPKQPAPTEHTVRAFRPTGLKVIFAILCVPELTEAPYRKIAEEAGVALGTVGWTFYDLKHLGYFRPTRPKGGIIEKRDQLINAWVEAYPQQLRPRLRPRRFRVKELDWWKTEDLTQLDMWLGQEPAAALLTRHLRPEIITIYGDTHFETLARKIHPIKDDHGNLEVLQKFWNFKPAAAGVKDYPVAPPLLIYADLVATGDARNLETAKMIRERFLA